MDDEQDNLEAERQEEDFQALMGMSLEDILREGQKALFARLVTACRGGKASHQEMAILRNVLKDNGLTLGIPPEDTAAATRAPVDLPEFGQPDYLQ